VRHPHRAAQIGPFTDEQKLRADALSNAVEDLHRGFHALHRPEVRQVNHELVVPIRRAQARAQLRHLAPLVVAAVEKIRNHSNVALERQRRIRFCFQAFGHGRDAVRSLDRKCHGLGIRRIAAKQRDIGTVQRGDDLRNLPARRLREDLLCEIGGCGVRNRIMRVDDVEGKLARELHDFIGKRQHVLRLAEQRIGWRLNAVEREASFVLAEPERRLRADQMHLMIPPRQRLGKLSGDDAAAADGCVAHHPDIHLIS
jgi:hypothetical protein